MFKEVADIKTADMLALPVPEAHFHNVAVKPSEMQKEMVASLAERAEKVRSGGVDSSVDNTVRVQVEAETTPLIIKFRAESYLHPMRFVCLITNMPFYLFVENARLWISNTIF